MIPPETSNASSLQICLFGPMDLRLNRASVIGSCTRKARHLLALLALRAGHEVERAWLAGTLWPQSAQPQANSNLRETLYHLRQVLAEQSPRLLSPTRKTLCLELTGAQVDVLAFDAARRRGDPQALAEMVAVYRGPLLEDCAEEWVLGERAVREQAYLQAREQLAEMALHAGDTVTAVGHLRVVIGVDPLRESAQRALMQALAANGDYAAAVQVYRELRLLLHRELNAQPDPQTTALFEQLRQQSRQQAQGARSAPSPTVPPAPPLRRLPQPISSLIGREQEITEVSASLSAVRLLTLTGAGGVGKTRLALASAEAVAVDYPDGVCFVDLAPLSDPALIPQTVATLLEVKEEPGRPLLETLRSALQSKSLLLVLDNCEHLLQDCVSVVAFLLEGSKHLKILATSRQSLGITGELVWRVPSLPVPPLPTAPAVEKEPVGVWLEYASVQLFVDRAQSVSPTFRLSQTNVGSVVAICQQLEGIPLALELAAVWLRSLSVEDLHRHLHDRFRLLTAGSRAARPRQQTLRAAVDWSYDLLSEPEQALLRRLSVFAGGCTLEAVEFVCSADEGIQVFRSSGVQEMPQPTLGDEVQPRAQSNATELENLNTRIPEHLNTDEVLDLLTSLVDKSLVQVEAREEGTRYRQLETIRQYAQERLAESGEGAAIRDRHLHYFLRLAEAAEPQLTGVDQALWLERLETEHDNLRAALEWSLNVGNREKGKGEREEERADSSSLKSQVSSLALAGALWRFWIVRGHLSEGRAYLAEALGQEGAQKRTQVRAKTLNGAGGLAYQQGDYAAARSFYEQSLEIGRELGDKRGIAASLGNLGNIAWNQGDYAAARTLYEECLAIMRELGHKGGIALALNNLGNVAQAWGDYRAARAQFEEGLAIRQGLGDKQGIAVSLGNLGSIASYQGDYATARALHEQSLEIGRELGDKYVISWSLHQLGEVAQTRGDSGTAEALFEQSLALFREAGDKGGIGSALMNLGNVTAKLGDLVAARALLEQSLAIMREIGNKHGIANASTPLGHLLLEEGDVDGARAHYEQGLALRRELENPLLIGWALLHVGHAAWCQHDHASVHGAVREALSLFSAPRHPHEPQGQLAGLESLAGLAHSEDEVERAARLFGAAEGLQERLDLTCPHGWQQAQRRLLSAAHDLPQTEELTRAWETGRAMTLQQAVEYALKAVVSGQQNGFKS